MAHSVVSFEIKNLLLFIVISAVVVGLVFGPRALAQKFSQPAQATKEYQISIVGDGGVFVTEVSAGMPDVSFWESNCVKLNWKSPEGHEFVYYCPRRAYIRITDKILE